MKLRRAAGKKLGASMMSVKVSMERVTTQDYRDCTTQKKIFDAAEPVLKKDSQEYLHLHLHRETVS